MFYDRHLMISALAILLLPTKANAINARNRNELGPRISLPQNVPYLRRDTNSSTALNNTTSNTTSSSEDFLWVIQDTYDGSNFFQ
jgi:hypothetical protein